MRGISKWDPRIHRGITAVRLMNHAAVKIGLKQARTIAHHDIYVHT